MGRDHDEDTSGGKAAPQAGTNQAPAPKTNGRDKPTITVGDAAPLPKSNGSGDDQRSATDQILDPHPVDLQDADVDVLKAAAESYVEMMYGVLDDAMSSATASLTEPPVEDKSNALAVLALVAETLAEMVADYVTDGMFEIAKSFFGPALKHATSERVSEVMSGAAEEVAKKVGAATAKQIESHGEHDGNEPEEHQADEAHEQGHKKVVRADPAAKTLVGEFKAREKIALRQKRADANVVTAAMVSVGRHDRKKLRDFAEQLKSPDLRLVALSGWYQQQVAVQWLNFSALATSGGKINQVPPDMKPTVDPHDPRNVKDGVIDVSIAVPSQIWGTQNLRLQAMKLTTSSPGATTILKNAPLPLLDVKVLRRIHFVGNDGKLSDSSPMTIYPDGSSLPSTDDYYLKAIGKLIPVSAEGGGIGGQMRSSSGGSGDASDTMRAPPDRVHSQLGEELQVPANNGDGAFALRGADLLTSWLSALDTGALK